MKSFIALFYFSVLFFSGVINAMEASEAKKVAEAAEIKVTKEASLIAIVAAQEKQKHDACYDKCPGMKKIDTSKKKNNDDDFDYTKWCPGMRPPTRNATESANNKSNDNDFGERWWPSYESTHTKNDSKHYDWVP